MHTRDIGLAGIEVYDYLRDNYDIQIEFGDIGPTQEFMERYSAGEVTELENAPIKIRNTILPVCNIGSTLSIPLLIAGFIFGFEPLVWVGIAFFSFTALFQFITLPVEFDASRRAIELLDRSGILYGDELKGSKKVLKAAGFTYVAGALTAILQLLRLIILFGGRDRD